MAERFASVSEDELCEKCIIRLSMTSWIIKTSCLCYLPQPSASADNTDLGFDNSRYHAQPHPIIVYYLAVSCLIERLGLSSTWILLAEITAQYICKRRGAMAWTLACSTLGWAVLAWVLTGHIEVCSWARQLTFTVPLSTQVFKWVLANLMLGLTLRWTKISSEGRGE